MRDYETRYADLKGKLEKVGGAKDSEMDGAVADALDQLKKARPEKKRAKLDPTKLPHRALEEKTAPTEEYIPTKGQGIFPQERCYWLPCVKRLDFRCKLE